MKVFLSSAYLNLIEYCKAHSWEIIKWLIPLPQNHLFLF